MNLKSIQPSQLYISESKLESVRSWFSPSQIKSYEPLPIKELDGVVFFTDGHTRALAAYISGIKVTKVYWDEDELDWDVYRECIKWCIDEGITSIEDLSDRIITHDEYKKLWLDRCQEMQDKLLAKREL
jgi:hypothetical protein